ncbi:DUF5753 domain-containing protein [Nocardia cyriacigeorgica]|uniref:DUF5753 domain-containing protein n=1 Tax=Nocardia cyriacigeorgica TaxID=135487 RepID=UPI0018936AF1|nr:DUF5753 domain-containing protein [Nocardia cyriacigeorgica]MBF6439276.1 transcriptional regulator [Nocardia cyriacigeorgica]
MLRSLCPLLDQEARRPMAPTSPTVAGWELMLRIRQRTKELGVTAGAIQKSLSIGATYWSQVVNFKGVLTEAKLSILLDMLEFSADERRELLELRAAAKERGWWNQYSALFGEDTLRLFGLEHGASSVNSYESGVIPGLLQSEDYIRALTSSIVATKPAESEQRVRVRLRRQQRLLDDDPLRLTVIVGQAALMQQVGGPAVQKAQLRHLAEMIESHPDTIDLRVIPFTAEGTAAVNAATVHLLDFDSARLPTVAWLESAVYAQLIDDGRMIDQLKYQYERTRSSALTRTETLDLIREVERGLS